MLYDISNYLEEDGICGSVIPETKTEGAGRAAAAGDPRFGGGRRDGLTRRAGAGAAGRRLGQRAGGVSRRVGPGEPRKKRFY